MCIRDRLPSSAVRSSVRCASTIPLRERSAPRLSDDTEPASSEKTLGRFRPWGHPKDEGGNQQQVQGGDEGYEDQGDSVEPECERDEVFLRDPARDATELPGGHGGCH